VPTRHKPKAFIHGAIARPTYRESGSAVCQLAQRAPHTAPPMS